nr:glycosyltransferase [Cohnella lupini]
MKISVIIPVYNMGAYIEVCLESVMSQTLKEIEVICINDGSTDHSLNILRRYSNMYSNLVVLDQDNCGVGASRNRGLSIARGEFIAFMDSDDFYPENDILECLYRSAKENNVLVCGGSLSRFVDGKVITAFSPRDRDYTFHADQIVSFREYQFSYGFTRFIYRLDFLKKNDLCFPPYGYFEDPPFLAKALHRAESFYSIKKVTYCYRIGHKLLRLSRSKILDYASGLLDLLRFSSEEKLGKLHHKLIEALHDDLAPAIYRAAEQNAVPQELAAQINRAIDMPLLHMVDLESDTIYLLEGDNISRYVGQMRAKEKEFVEQLVKYKEIIIYGAGKVGTATAEYIQTLNSVHAICFAVTKGTNNPSRVNGLEVKWIDELISYKENALILVATYPYLHEEIQNALSQLGFHHILPINYQALQLFGMRADV